jgi:hypothetical protein
MATKNDEASAKRILRIKEEERKAKLRAINDWISFFVSRGTGLGATVCGGLDLFNPSLIPHISHPDKLLGAGLALLAGRSVLSGVAKIVKLFD